MASATEVKSFRQMIGIPPSTASVKDSTLVIIDAQNEYVPPPPLVLLLLAYRLVYAACIGTARGGGGGGGAFVET